MEMPALLMRMSTPPNASRRRLNNRGGAVLGCHRMDVCDGLPAKGANLFRDGLGRCAAGISRRLGVAPDVIHDDIGPARGQEERMRAAEARIAARSRHDGGAPVEAQLAGLDGSGLRKLHIALTYQPSGPLARHLTPLYLHAPPARGSRSARGPSPVHRNGLAGEKSWARSQSHTTAAAISAG